MTSPHNPEEEPLGSAGRGSSLIEHPRSVHVYAVTEQELDSLFSLGTNLLVSLPLATAFLSVCITMGLAFFTIPTDSQYAKAVLTVGSVVSGVLTVAFGVWAGWCLVLRQRTLRNLKRPRYSPPLA